MKFCTFTLIDNSPDPITGVRLSTAESSPPAVLAYIAAVTTRIRLLSDVVPVLRAAYPSRVWA